MSVERLSLSKSKPAFKQVYNDIGKTVSGDKGHCYLYKVKDLITYSKEVLWVNPIKLSAYRH